MKQQLNNLSIWLFLFVTTLSNAQYTETINTNNPGRSQGAFAVGKNVVQVEGSLLYQHQDHSLLQYERDYNGIDFQLRYGLLLERLEISIIGQYDRVNQTDFAGGGSSEVSFANFSRTTVGLKYLVFDPALFFGEKKVNLLSYRANHRLDWRDLIPAVSVYAGANVGSSVNNPLVPPNDPTVSPRVELITQNNWGRWVFVTNFVADRIATDFPSYQWFLTMTHSINGKWAVFGEYQGLKSDFYSDDLGRGGVAYLISKDWQVDASGTFNLKDTPALYQVNLGMSYRLDFHKDEAIKEKSADRKKTKKSDKKNKKINLEDQGI